MKKRQGAKGKTTAAAKSKAKKKAKEDGEYEGSSEDEYTAVSRNLWSMGSSGDPKPPVGSFEECARCEKQFTVVIMDGFLSRLAHSHFLYPDEIYAGSESTTWLPLLPVCESVWG